MKVIPVSQKLGLLFTLRHIFYSGLCKMSMTLDKLIWPHQANSTSCERRPQQLLFKHF